MIRTEMWSTTVRAYLFLSFTALCFGANTTLAKLAVGEVSPMMVVALRWLLVVGLLVAFNSRTLVRDWPSLKPHMGFLFAMGALGFAAFNGLFYVAAHHTTAINMGIISGMLPVFVLAGALIVYKTPVGKLQWVGASITLLGEAQIPTLRGWGVVVLVALFPSFLAQLTFIKGVEIIGPGRAGIFVNLVPVFGAALAVIFLGEEFHLYHGIALALVLGGIWVAERSVKNAP